MGTYKDGISIKSLADLVKNRLHIDKLSYTGSDETMVYNVLIQTGAFDLDLYDIKKGDIDVIITGDVKYHTAKELMSEGIYIIDAGHFGTEIIFSGVLSDQLRKAVPDVTIKRVDFEKNIFTHV
jgi:putative NIF3 family GTP cyclohydrolase 1 type 2